MESWGSHMHLQVNHHTMAGYTKSKYFKQVAYPKMEHGSSPSYSKVSTCRGRFWMRASALQCWKLRICLKFGVYTVYVTTIYHTNL